MASSGTVAAAFGVSFTLPPFQPLNPIGRWNFVFAYKYPACLLVARDRELFHARYDTRSQLKSIGCGSAYRGCCSSCIILMYIYIYISLTIYEYVYGNCPWGFLDFARAEKLDGTDSRLRPRIMTRYNDYIVCFKPRNCNYCRVLDISRCVKLRENPHGKKYICKIYIKVYKINFFQKLYIRNMIKHVFYLYIFVKIYLRFIWNTLDVYLNDAKIYFREQKLYMSHIYFNSMGEERLIETNEKFYIGSEFHYFAI